MAPTATNNFTYDTLGHASTACWAASYSGFGCGGIAGGYVTSQATYNAKFGGGTTGGGVGCSGFSSSQFETCDVSYYYYGDGTCPAGTLADVTGFCGPDCQPGSLTSDCAVSCPLKEYTYTLNGVSFRGKSGGGTVGYGQVCPEPSYPSGSGGYCIGDPGTCENYDQSYNDGTPVTEETTTTDTQDNGDGTSTTTETTTTTETGGSDASGGSGGSSGSSDGTVKNDAGDVLDPSDYDGTVDIGGQTYGLCPHGGVVSAYGGCDYPSHNCSSWQIDSVSGCVDIPGADNPDNALPETDPVSITVTDTDADGNTTSTTVSAPGHDGTNGADGVVDPEGGDSGSASGDCDTPPSSSGDAQLAAIHLQLWNNRCMEQTSTSGDCDSSFTCDGNFFECEVLKRNHEFDCAEMDAEDVESLVEGLATERGLVTTNDLDAAATASGINFDEELDITDMVSPLESVPTSSGTCPGDISIALGSLGTIPVPLSELCTLFTWIGYLVRLSASVVAFRMLFSTIQGV